MLILLAAIASQDINAIDPVLKSWWLPVHAGLSLIAYACLALAFIGSLMYLVQEWELKK